MWAPVLDECQQAEYTGIAMEYGTQPIEQVLGALRADHWLMQHPEAPPEPAGIIQRQLVGAFYAATPEWQQRIVDQGEAIGQAVDGLANEAVTPRAEAVIPAQAGIQSFGTGCESGRTGSPPARG